MFKYLYIYVQVKAYLEVNSQKFQSVLWRVVFF